MVDMTLKRPSD